MSVLWIFIKLGEILGLLAIGASALRGALSTPVACELTHHGKLCDRLLFLADRTYFCGALSLDTRITRITLK